MALAIQKLKAVFVCTDHTPNKNIIPLLAINRIRT